MSRLKTPLRSRAPSSHAFAPSSPVSPPSPTFSRPIKQIRRQSRSFSTFTASLQLFASPATPTSSNQFAPQSPLSRDEGQQLKRAISYPLLVHTSLGFDSVASPDWFGTRDTTQRFANTSSFLDSPTSFGNCLTVDDTESFSISFPRLDAIEGSDASHRRFSDESRVETPTRATSEYEAFNEVSRFSSSTESSPSTCYLTPSEQSHGPVDVLGGSRAKSPGGDSLLDLDFDNTAVVPLSPPPSPEEYRHQPLPVSSVSPPTQAWLGRPIDEDPDVVDPMMAFSYSPTPPERVRGDQSRFFRPSSIFTPPQTPSLDAVMAEHPSPLMLPSPVTTLRTSTSYDSPSLLSLAIEELSTEFERAETLWVALPSPLCFLLTPLGSQLDPFDADSRAQAVPVRLARVASASPRDADAQLRLFARPEPTFSAPASPSRPSPRP